MAELTDEQEIVIGVTVSIAAIVFIAVVVIICCIFYKREKNKGNRRHVKDKRIIRDLYYERPPAHRPYTVENNIYPKGRTVFAPPPYRPEPLPLPRFREPPGPLYSKPPGPLYSKPQTIEPYVVKSDRWETRSEPPVEAVEKHYYGDVQRSGYDDIYHNEPIVIQMSQPEYTYARTPRPTQQTHYVRYQDDQALLRQSRSDNVTHPLRRSHSAYRQSEVRKSRDQPYVGEWEVKPDGLNTFNQQALDQGRDPFLWKR